MAGSWASVSAGAAHFGASNPSHRSPIEPIGDRPIIRSLSLQAGTRLGPYEIQSPLGAGGMGEVYRARDTRLERTVAVKILPAQVAGDVQFRERFEHEARTISQLDHPHICALYDVGEEHGTSFLVMQYLEGETLAERLAQG